jgi:hypothetical protein
MRNSNSTSVGTGTSLAEKRGLDGPKGILVRESFSLGTYAQVQIDFLGTVAEPWHSVVQSPARQEVLRREEDFASWFPTGLGDWKER